MFVRVWDYEVPSDRTGPFTEAYAADGAWAELFSRVPGLLGTELYRDAARADRFLTIDRWQNEQHWRSFLNAFGPAYESLDAKLEGLAAAERSGRRCCRVRRRSPDPVIMPWLVTAKSGDSANLLRDSSVGPLLLFGHAGEQQR